MKINWSFIEPVRDQAARLRGDFTAKSEIVKLAEQQAEIDRLREENARLRAVIQFILDNQISERRSEHIDCVIIHGEPIRAARAAIREGGE